MSALTPKADTGVAVQNVRLVPIADIEQAILSIAVVGESLWGRPLDIQKGLDFHSPLREKC